MSIQRTALVSIGVVGALWIAWIAWGGVGGSPRDAIFPGEAESALDRDGLRPSASQPVENSEGIQRASELTASDAAGERKAVDSGAFDLAGAHWIVGRVKLPNNLPGDERAFVVATGRRADANALGLGQEEQEDGPVILSRAELDSVGGFRLLIPSSSKHVHLGVRGRYLFSERSVPYDVGTEREVVLDSSLGAWIVGSFGEGRDTASNRPFEARLSVDSEGISHMFDGSAWALRKVPGHGVHFEFEAVAAPGSVRVVALADDAPAATSERLHLIPGRRYELSLRGGLGGTLRGMVLDSEGEPFGDVLVFALDDANFLAGRTGRRVREAQTDGEGRFELNGVASGALSLRAEMPGHLVASKRVELSPGETIEGVSLTLTKGRRIVGRVLGADGAGRENAKVTAVFDVGMVGGIEGLGAVRGNFQETTTDAQGDFELSGLGRGPFALGARWLPDGLAGEELEKAERARQAHTARKDRVAPGGDPVELVLTPPLAIEGRVLVGEDLPAQRFQVLASRSAGGLVADFGREVVQRKFDGQDGLFQLWGVRPGTWDVVVSAEDTAPSEAQTVSLPRPADAPPLEFRLRPEATIAGRVLLPDGLPAVGAEVSVSTNSLERMSNVFHSLGKDASLTDSRGAFKLGGFTGGRFSLVARASGYAESLAVEVDVPEGMSLEDAVLQLRVGATITGEVYGKKGLPAVGDAIIAQITGSLDMLQTSSDAQGRFRFEDVFPGKWQVVAMPNEDRIAEALEEESSGIGALLAGVRMRLVSIEEGEQKHVVLGEPLPDPVRVFGQVTIDGEGVPGAVVSFVGDSAREGSVRFESADSEGRYEIALPGPGSYLMLVQRMGQVMAETSLEYNVEVPETDSREIDVALPLGRLSGMVEGPEGEPLVGARVSLVGGKDGSQTVLGGQFTETVTGADGRYDIDWLRPGTYQVSAGGVRYGGMFGDPSPWGRGRGRSVPVQKDEHVTGVDFRLERGGALAGNVRDVGGAAVSGAAVFVYDSGGRIVERLSFVTTDSAGAYKAQGLSPGEYSLLVRSAGLASSMSERVLVKSGESASLDVELVPGTVLEVETLGSHGKPLAAGVRVLDERGIEVSGAISFAQMVQAIQDGSSKSLRQVGPLAPGRYVVSASAPGVSAERKVRVKGQASRRVVLRLK